MPIRLFLVSQVVRLSMRRRFAQARSVWPLRAMMAKMARDIGPPPKRIALAEITLGGVRGERLASGDADARAAILYVHGGAFIAGTPRNHRALTWRLAERTRVPVYAIDYRLAPEHPFPAGLDDVVAAYRALSEKGIERIAIAGDSAGGNLTLAAALDIARLGLPRPRALACLSPVTTLVEELPSAVENRDRDAMFPPGVMADLLSRYAPGAADRDPRVSPLYAADLSKLPPTLFQVSAVEALRDHSVQMADRMRAAGVRVELEVVPRVFHVWHLLADHVPEARTAIDRLAAFLRPLLLNAKGA